MNMRRVCVRTGCGKEIDPSAVYVGFPEMTGRTSYYHVKCFNEFNYCGIKVEYIRPEHFHTKGYKNYFFMVRISTGGTMDRYMHVFPPGETKEMFRVIRDALKNSDKSNVYTYKVVFEGSKNPEMVEISWDKIARGISSIED